jgi:hypothetical protein
MKIAICLIGESFRKGSQNTRIHGTEDSFEEQKKACDSQINYFEYLQSKGHNIDLYIHTYSTLYDADLLSWFSPFLKYSILQKEIITTCIQSHINLLLPKISLDDYDFLIFLRIDLFLKPLFFNLANPNEITQITFPFICWLKSPYTPDNSPRISDTMIFIPKKYFTSKKFYFKLHHNSWQMYKTLSFEYSDMNILCKTFHDSDSEKDWNPLYKIVNRNFSNKWYSIDFIYDSEIWPKIEKVKDEEFHKQIYQLFIEECS